MEIFDAKNTPFLLTTEAFEIYSQCMYQPTFDEYKNELSELASKPAISMLLADMKKVSPHFMATVPRILDVIYNAINKNIKSTKKGFQQGAFRGF